MEDKNKFRGLELLFSIIKDRVRSREDCLVAAIHILMINKGNKCVGVGNNWEEQGNPSEILPDNWNDNQELYTLKYVSGSSGIRYLMKVVRADNTLLVNLYNVNEEKAAGMSVNTGNFISTDFRDFIDAYKDLDALGKAFHLEIVQKVRPKSANSSESRSSQENPSSTSQVDPPNPNPYAFVDDGPMSLRDPGGGFPAIGRGDLDPLGGGVGGGMLFQPPPMRPGMIGPNIPRGSVPPGARFDPFGPPIGRSRGGFPRPPDPDNMFGGYDFI